MDNVSEFVNNNAANVTFVYNDNFDAAEEQFAKKVKNFDSTNDDAFPVIVYLNGDNFVAWVDLELARGFIG